MFFKINFISKLMKRKFYVLQDMTEKNLFSLNGKNLSPTALCLKMKPWCHVKYKGVFVTIPNI